MIGTRVAELASAVGCRTIETKRDLSEVPETIDEIYAADEHRVVARESDYLVIACPLTDETRGLTGMDEWRLSGEEGVVVNVARGAVRDEDALATASQYHVIRGAALDTFETEPLPVVGAVEHDRHATRGREHAARVRPVSRDCP